MAIHKLAGPVWARLRGEKRLYSYVEFPVSPHRGQGVESGVKPQAVRRQQDQGRRANPQKRDCFDQRSTIHAHNDVMWTMGSALGARRSALEVGGGAEGGRFGVGLHRGGGEGKLLSGQLLRTSEMTLEQRQRAAAAYGTGVQVTPAGVTVADAAVLASPATDRVVWQAVFGAPGEQEAARWLLWEIGQAVGVMPASIHDLYTARGRGECGGFTVPAINVRMIAYDTARAVFRAAIKADGGAILLEIARSEIAYTEQRPAEYVAVMIGAALREGYRLPLFIGRSLSGQREEIPDRPRGRNQRGQEADRRGGRGRFLQHRCRYLDTGRSVPPDARRAAARQLRPGGRDHGVHSGPRAEGRHGVGRRGNRRGRP